MRKYKIEPKRVRMVQPNSKKAPNIVLVEGQRDGLSSIDGEEKTQKEVADMLGISQSYISRLEKKIIKRLKKEMIKSI